MGWQLCVMLAASIITSPFSLHYSDYFKRFGVRVQMLNLCVLKKVQKTAQFPTLQSLSSLGKNVPSSLYTHMLPPVAFDKGNSIVSGPPTQGVGGPD